MEHSNQEVESKTPAPRATTKQRIWAWVGAIYMVIIVLLITYSLAHGHYLAGISQILLVPAMGGATATALHNYRVNRSIIWAVMLAAGAFFTLYHLVKGLPVLLAAL